MITFENLKDSLCEPTKEAMDKLQSAIGPLLKNKTEEEVQAIIDNLAGNDFGIPSILIPRTNTNRRELNNPHGQKSKFLSGKNLLTVLDLGDYPKASAKFRDASEQLREASEQLREAIKQFKAEETSVDFYYSFKPATNTVTAHKPDNRSILMRYGNTRPDFLKLIGYKGNVNTTLLNEVLDKIKDPYCEFIVDQEDGEYHFEIQTRTVVDEKTGQTKTKKVKGNNLNKLLAEIMKSYNNKVEKEIDKVDNTIQNEE